MSATPPEILPMCPRPAPGAPPSLLGSPQSAPAGLESTQSHKLLQPIPTCLLSPAETTNPSQSRSVFLSISPKGLEKRRGGGGTQQVCRGRQAAQAD